MKVSAGLAKAGVGGDGDAKSAPKAIVAVNYSTYLYTDRVVQVVTAFVSILMESLATALSTMRTER